MSELSDAYSEIQRMMHLMEGPEGALENEPLAPDGKYQTRTVTLRQLTDEVASRLSRSLQSRSAADLPLLFCSWGKCRVGSTALTNLFGIAGIPALYQPVKTMARHRLLGGEPQIWCPPQACEHPHIFSKEMAGPYLVAETIFNPLNMMIAAGYPPEKLHLLVLDREPYASLASWIARWSDRVPRARLIQHFALSSLQIRRMRSYARANGIAVTHYVYEASRRPMEAIEALFRRLDISQHFHPGVVRDWNERGALASKQSGISFPEEPPIYVVPGLHSSEKQYSYKPRDTGNLSAAECRLVSELALPQLYQESVTTCIQDLGFDRSLTAQMFGPEAFAAARE
jgi:hypothetical protein